MGNNAAVQVICLLFKDVNIVEMTACDEYLSDLSVIFETALLKQKLK